MITVSFSNLEKSELAREVALERLKSVIQKFPQLNQSRIRVTLEMENSPIHPGPDVFVVKVHVKGGRYGDVHIERSASNMYVALADMARRMPEILNRSGDRVHVRDRRRRRRFISEIHPDIVDASDEFELDDTEFWAGQAKA